MTLVSDGDNERRNMNIELNEVDRFAFVSMIISMVMFLIGLFWDGLVGVHVAHHEGLGLGQIIWCTFWGIYSIWAWSINSKWRNYIKQIHKIGK
jgi:hypothetical protein